MDKPVSELIKTLKDKGLKLALAESVTCGLAAHTLSTVTGTSDVFAGCVVCYTPEVKTNSLGVSQRLIKKCTCESKEVTEALAKKLHKVIKADVYAGITGLASPGGSEGPGKPVGTVFFSVLYKGKIHNTKKIFRGSPMEIKRKACMTLYKTITGVIR